MLNRPYLFFKIAARVKPNSKIFLKSCSLTKEVITSDARLFICGVVPRTSLNFSIFNSLLSFRKYNQLFRETNIGYLCYKKCLFLPLKKIPEFIFEISTDFSFSIKIPSYGHKALPLNI